MLWSIGVMLNTVVVQVHWSLLRHESDVLRGAFLCGLALCNQHTIVLYAMPFVFWILTTMYTSGKLTAQRVGLYAGLFFAGLLPYLYLPIASR